MRFNLNPHPQWPNALPQVKCNQQLIGLHQFPCHRRTRGFLLFMFYVTCKIHFRRRARANAIEFIYLVCFNLIGFVWRAQRQILLCGRVRQRRRARLFCWGFRRAERIIRDWRWSSQRFRQQLALVAARVLRVLCFCGVQLKLDWAAASERELSAWVKVSHFMRSTNWIAMTCVFVMGMHVGTT